MLKRPVCSCHLHIPITHPVSANEPLYLPSKASGLEPACARGLGAKCKDTIHKEHRAFSHLLLVLLDWTFVPHCSPPQTAMLHSPRRREEKLHGLWRGARTELIKHPLCPQSPLSPRSPSFPSPILCRGEADAWVLSNRTEDYG